MDFYTRARQYISPTAKTYITQLCADTGCSLKDKLGTINDRLSWLVSYFYDVSTLLVLFNAEQLCKDTGCSPENLSEAMNDMEKWRERVRDIRASGMT